MPEIVSGWWQGARRCPSPNHDARPGECTLDLIVVHGISLPPCRYGGNEIDALFTNCLDPQAHPYFEAIHTLRVSSHLLIRRDGELVQYVPFDMRAWHAGLSSYRGRERCNDFAIGIELEGCDEQCYEAVQYRRLCEVCAGLIAHYPTLSQEAIVGHSDIAPGRKSDPGPYFEWEGFRFRLAVLIDSAGHGGDE